MQMQFERQRRLSDVHRFSCSSFFLTTLVLLIVSLQTTGVAMGSSTDASERDDFLKGEVTGKREHVLLINNKEYSFVVGVTVKDTTLTVRTLEDVVPGTQILFHLTQGLIDRIIIILPS